MSNATHQVEFKTQLMTNPMMGAHAGADNAKHMLQRDQARAAHMRAGHQPHPRKHHHHHKDQPCPPGSDGSTVISVVDAGVTYLATVGFGSPKTDKQLLIDTGSSNTWFKGPYNSTSTTKDMRKEFQISYGLGSCQGNEYTDQVTMGSMVLKDQPVGVAQTSDHMDGMDGILGIGPCYLTKGTLMSGDGDSKNRDSESIPTITDNMLKQGVISQECIGISYAPATGTNNAATGSLSFGGPDMSKCTGQINYVPVTKQSPACYYWGIEQSICYGDQEIMADCAGISDTGTTLCMMPTSAIQAYQKMTGAVMDQSCGLLTVTEEQYDNMQSMFFNIGGTKYELTKNAQILPRCNNEMFGVPAGKLGCIFADMGDVKVGDGLCFILGYTFLQRFYSVYDTTNNRIGYATTEHTMATTN